jgi:peptidoglycan hydrolase-like protein with peptidoglycan-binding domain
VKKKVMKTPATTRELEIPAEYKVVKVNREVTPADVRRTPVSAEYQTVTKKELVSEGRMEWRQIVCETNATKEIITEVQNALRTAGHNPGPINGKLGAKTLQAIRLYQKDKGLPTGGLTVQTLESLGVKAQ